MNHIASPLRPHKSQANDDLAMWDRYRDLGLDRLHPIIPAGAMPSSRWLGYQMSGRGVAARAMSRDRALAVWAHRNAIGKLPGVWQIDGWTPRNVQDLKQAYSDDRMPDYRTSVVGHAGGIGVSGSELIGLDIDVTDPAASLEVQAVLFKILSLPRDCLRRIGQPPKLLVPFQLATGAKAFGKPGKLVLADGKGAVEWLTVGQQWVLEGVHGGTGQPYFWPWGRLWDRPGGLAALPEIDEDAAVGALRRVQKALGRAAGSKPVRRGALPGTRVPPGRPMAPEYLVCSVGWAWEMLQWIRNTPATSREEYVSIAHHLMGCSGGAAWGRELFLQWAEEWHRDDPEHNAALWDGLTQVRTGWEPLMRLAASHGMPHDRTMKLRVERQCKTYQEGNP